MPSLYVVSTPIGNLEDLTLRALRLLGEVALIAAEDSRTIRKLLNRYNLKTPVTSYHEHNRKAKTPFILEVLQSRDVALVSEAGAPSISDPGYDLVARALEAGITVVPIPGPSAVTAALMVSGLPADQFLFLGFLPRRPKERQRLLSSLAWQPRTMVAFEAPHRLRATLQDLVSALGDRRVAVCRELTKLHEEVFHGTLSQATARFSEPLGEFTLVIEGGTTPTEAMDADWVDEKLLVLKREGRKAKEAVAAVAQASGLSKREVYQRWLALFSAQRPTP